jgi:hypothetical protein
MDLRDGLGVIRNITFIFHSAIKTWSSTQDFAFSRQRVCRDVGAYSLKSSRLQGATSHKISSRSTSFTYKDILAQYVRIYYIIITIRIKLP